MSGRKIKCGIAPDGGLFFIDPGFDCLPFIKKLKPDFRMRSVPPAEGFVPSFQKARKARIPFVAPEDLETLSTGELWELHQKALKEGFLSFTDQDGASLLELKTELAKRSLASCRLCGRQCGTNRFESLGACGLGADAAYECLFVHAAEEPPITPATSVSMKGCGLRCAFCQSSENFSPEGGRELGPGMWQELERVPGFREAASLEFVGGNPDESVYGIMKALEHAPEGMRLPLVMNDNGYAEESVYRLMDGIVDVWLTDFKFGNEECGLRLAGARNYFEVAKKGIDLICRQRARVIIRIPVLPGHVDCCAGKIIEFLSAYRDKVWVSIIDNYLPAWKAREHPAINRMASEDEVRRIRELAALYKLRDIYEFPEGFWKGV